MDASRDAFAPCGLPGHFPMNTAMPLDGAGIGAASQSPNDGGGSFRPTCDAGFESPGSTSLKWGSDGELTAQDLHHVLARLLVHDQEACRMMDGDPSAPFG